jgi:hypothetical protein
MGGRIVNWLDWLDGKPATQQVEADAQPLILSHPGTERWFQGPESDHEKEAGD